ncbi:polysaccharide deacetylase family protein [Paenibacillus sp. LHD-117]|uniref:polysaccharide deacetylase family protein n=1 Tax=Paenibacillus sp. LHD-117 TaxID=3071412 RepID=UPI0027DF1AD2|nr:polysaccharide deacetylase family protein [Paenibacillus sp. LHD-117]MDQ6422574.1 polysaccharide deacetylase family protein [Paenibacillus sp. LHD-117]
MRRMVQASLCATVLWFGMMHLDGGFMFKGVAAGAAGTSNDMRTITYQYEAKTLLARPGGQPERAGAPNDRGANVGQAGASADAGNGEDAGNVGIGDEPAAETGAGADKGAGAEADTSVGKGTNDGDGEVGGATTAEGKAAESGTAKGGKAGQASGKVVYLTFDDGPSQHTPAVLDILKKAGVHATFFLLGEQVERHPDIVRRIANEGHAIGNHTYNHVYKELYGSFKNFAGQIMKTDDAIHNAVGIRTTLVRAPGGTYANFDKGYFDAMRAAGYRVHDWNVDSGDSKRLGVPASEIIANVRGSKLADTLNVLMHDSGGHEETVKALPAIIDYYKKLGYSFKTLDEKTEPMQFHLANKPKWSRGDVAEADKKSLVAFAAKLDRGAGAARQPEPVLIVHRGDDTLELDPSEYELVNGSIHVPLGKLSEWLGGTAALDEEEGVIEVTLEERQWFWLTDSFPPKPGDEERLDVPIRATLEQFGMEIEDYVFTKERREVWILS